MNSDFYVMRDSFYEMDLYIYDTFLCDYFYPSSCQLHLSSVSLKKANHYING
jgi:hypothetical protein